MPTTRASFLAMYLTPIAPSAPTRMCWSTPSFMSASGSPVSIEVRKIRPQKRPGREEYFSSVTTSPSRVSYTTSDFMRIAKYPAVEPPSIVPH